MSTDYKQTSLSFRLQKVVRYVGLYGVGRTVTKVRAQYRLPSTGEPLTSTWVNPKVRSGSGGRDVAIIGCGAFSYTTIAFYCHKKDGGSIASVYDPIGPRAISLCRDYGGMRAVATVDEIVSDPSIKLVYIASNHASHAEYAIQCIAAGKHVHIEKPHVVTADQLERLGAAMGSSPQSKVFLGFNRPRSRHFRFLQRILGNEDGPIMLNWFVAGHEIPPDHWYFSDSEGGRVLGNLCHWTDLSLQMVGVDKAFPCEVGVGGDHGSPSDFVVTFAFADASSGAITFSAKGHTFEGVREVLNCHRGNALCSLEDFQTSRADVGARRQRLRSRFRDHGHENNILHSFDTARSDRPGESELYVRLTGALFLAARVVVDTRKSARVNLDGSIESLTG